MIGHTRGKKKLVKQRRPSKIGHDTVQYGSSDRQANHHKLSLPPLECLRTAHFL